MPDTQRERKIMAVAKEAIEALRNKAAGVECGEVKVDRTSKYPPHEIEEQDLKATLMEYKSV